MIFKNPHKLVEKGEELKKQRPMWLSFFIIWTVCFCLYCTFRVRYSNQEEENQKIETNLQLTKRLEGESSAT